jgi:hypothetical protein
MADQAPRLVQHARQVREEKVKSPKIKKPKF